jgi:hypothetical protein
MDPPYSPLDSPTDPPMDPHLVPTWAFSIGRFVSKIARKLFVGFNKAFNELMDVFSLVIIYVGSILIFWCALVLIVVFPFLAPLYFAVFLFTVFSLTVLLGFGFTMNINTHYLVTAPVYFLSHVTRYLVRFVGWAVMGSAVLQLFVLLGIEENIKNFTIWFGPEMGFLWLGGIGLFCGLIDLLRSRFFPTEAEGRARRRAARRASRAKLQRGH